MSMLNFQGGKKLPSILQAEQSECALACLAMVSGYYGHKIDINTLRNKYNISQQGTTLKIVMEIAEKMNLSSRALRLELQEMGKLKIPAVLHWKMNHFVVLKKVTPQKILIHDPAIGAKKISYEDAGKYFTGVALELTPTKDFSIQDEERKLKLHQLWSKATGFKRTFFKFFLLSILLEIFAIASPYFTQLIIDDVLVNNDIDLLKILMLAFLLLILIKSTTAVLRSYVGMYFSNKLGFQFGVNISRHLLKLSVEYFSKRHIGDIVSRFSSMGNIKDFISSGIAAVCIDGIMVIGTLIMMFVYNKLLTFIAILSIIIYTIIRIATYHHIRAKSEEQLAAMAAENTNFMENIRTIQGIKLFGKETDRLALWQTYFVDAINTGIRVQKFGVWTTAVDEFLNSLQVLLILYFGALSVLNNQMSIGMLMAFISWKDTFAAKSFSLMKTIIDFKLLDVHLSRLSDIVFSKPEENIEGCNIQDTKEITQDFFTVNNLAFRYSEHYPFLFSNVNLNISNKETIAIIGPSGCGKSTLLKVLSSLFLPTEGQIQFHGINIQKTGLQNYRKKIGVVMQDDGLLTGSISENISFFDPLPDQGYIEYAASLAAIDTDIRQMPMQYNTLVGNLGSALSGGQIQRILLARALYKKPSILFLDEATSHLDIEAEQHVNHAIKKLKMARIIVAHRPETIRLADRIFYLTKQGLVQISKKQFDERTGRNPVK